MERYYTDLITELNGWTIEGLFNGSRAIEDITVLQTGTKGRIFFFDQEPLIKDIDKKLWDYVFEKPTILANSELNSADKEYLKDNYPNFVDWYYFSHGLLSREWFGSQYFANSSDWPFTFESWDATRIFTFDCNLVTGNRQYRLKFLQEFQKRNLLEYSHYSFNSEYNWLADLKKYDYFGLLKETNLLIPSKTVSHDNFGNFMHTRSTVETVPMSTIIPIDTYVKSYVVLVLETVFTENKKHLTEKIFKPIAGNKPFILAGGYQNLKYLRRYGFETFGDLWNENYDEISDPTERIHSIVDLINNLCHLPYSQQKDIIFAAHEISLKNWFKFWQGYTENLCKVEAFDNLKIAKAELESKQV
jgi:hypothetical protein